MMIFKGTPLFGQDSNPQYTSKILGLGGTALFWLILLIVLIFAKPIQTKPKYKEVQIVLSSTPTVKKQQESPAPAETAASAPAVTESKAVTTETKPVVTEQKTAVAEPVKKTEPVKKAEPKPVQKTETKPVQKTEPKPAEKTPVKKMEPKPIAPVEPIEYAVDPMEAFAQQTQKKPKKEFDWSMFDDEPVAEAKTEESAVKKIQNDEPLFSGAAATSAQTSSQPVTSSSSANKSVNQNTSNSTNEALSKISNANFNGRSANGVSSETTVKSAVSGSGKVMLEMSNGNSRALLDPAKPVINLSEAAAATIDGSRTVKIRFRVVEAGNVPRGEIKITPESILSEIVKSEIFDQISRWRFEPADYSAFAEFEYKIVKQ